ncbi:MAG: type IV secretory system conjugative DNA transfer family protein [Clostridiales bacterium]|nr:type IV secretory system conjugative DNA transfer family protein [Clostridiales bacterium]
MYLYQDFKREKCYGAEFARTERIKESLTKIDLLEEAYDQGGIPIITEEDDAWIDTEDNHSLIFGSTGSKKSRLFAMPLIEILAKAGESFFVTDPKGELFDKTAAVLEGKGYYCMVMDFRDFKRSDSWNPIDLASQLYRDGRIEQAYEVLMDLVEGLGESVRNKNDPYWENAAKNLLHGLLILLLEQAPITMQNIKSLLKMVEECHDEGGIVKNIDRYIDNPIVCSKLRLLNNASTKTVGSVMAIVDAMINIFLTQPKLAELLSQRCLDLRQYASRKIAIYFILPDERTTYHFIASIFIKQFYEMLIMEAQNNQRKQLEIRMNFILDEFSNLPKIPDMPSMITAARSRNIRFYLFVQSQYQLESKYGEDAHTIKGNCNNWIFLNSRERALLEELEQLCGECVYENNMRKSLISISELQQLRKDKGEALVLVGRNAPYITRLYDIDDYPWESYEPLEKPETYLSDAEVFSIEDYVQEIVKRRDIERNIEKLFKIN